jgi:hypothetical protein
VPIGCGGTGVRPLRVSVARGLVGMVGRVPARYRVRLHGRTLTVWDTDPTHARRTAQEWLDCSDKAGVDPLATVSVERIGDKVMNSDLLGTLDDVPPTHPALTASFRRYWPKWWERALVPVVSVVRRLFVRDRSSSQDM